MIEPVYTATEIATFIAAIGVLITGIGAVIVNIIVALRQGRKVDDLGSAVAQVHQEAKVISGHVNSAATASSAKIENLQREVEQMRSTATEMKTTAALLAQALATTAAAAAGAKPAEAKPPDLTER